MAGWDGVGNFTRNYNWVVDRDAGIKILSTKMDTEDDTLTAGINACLAKNGENTATGNLPMGGNKHTGVAASVDRTDYLRVAEYQDGSHNAVDGGGAADVQTLTLAPAITAYSKYQRFRFVPTADNTGACTLNVNAVGAKSIKLVDGTDPSAADLDATGITDVIYDGTNFVLMNPATAMPNGTQTLANKTLTSPVLNSPTINNPTITGWSLATANISAAGVISNGPAGWTAGVGAAGVFTLTHGLALASPGEQQVHITSDDVAGSVDATVTIRNTNFITYNVTNGSTGAALSASHMVLFTAGGLG